MKVYAKCTQKGHVFADCKIDVYCDICDSVEHVNHKCPVLKFAKPVVQAVGYAVDGLGFQHIPHQPLQRSKKGTKKALVRVVGGSLTIEKLVALLHKLCPAKWKWEQVPQGEEAFVILFPLKSEMQRAINFGGADVKEGGVPTGIRVEFEEWFEEEEGFLLPKVWVKVFGLRKKLREYLTLWAMGSLLGATQLVDTKTTRKNEFGRFFVAVLNPKLIPKMIDVVIGDHYFELKFEVEKKGVDENGEEVEFNLEDWDGDEEDGNSEGEEYKENNEGKERESKRTKNDDMAIDDNKENSERKENEVQEGGDQGREDVILEMAENVLDVAVERVLGEEYERVEREEEKIDGAVMQQEKVEQLANIEEVLVTPKRASERLMGSSGRHSLEKEKSRKVWMNLDLLSGNESKNSFLSFSQAHIIENLKGFRSEPRRV